MAITDKGYFWLALLGLVMSMISVYYYMLVVRAMYSKDAKDQQAFTASGSLRIVALISLIATLFIGIYPAPLAALANAAAQSLW
jgi:NADH-quinone oxidoreductase subunit N